MKWETGLSTMAFGYLSRGLVSDRQTSRQTDKHYLLNDVLLNSDFKFVLLGSDKHNIISDAFRPHNGRESCSFAANWQERGKMRIVTLENEMAA